MTTTRLPFDSLMVPISTDDIKKRQAEIQRLVDALLKDGFRKAIRVYRMPGKIEQYEVVDDESVNLAIAAGSLIHIRDNPRPDTTPLTIRRISWLVGNGVPCIVLPYHPDLDRIDPPKKGRVQ